MHPYQSALRYSMLWPSSIFKPASPVMSTAAILNSSAQRKVRTSSRPYQLVRHSNLGYNVAQSSRTRHGQEERARWPQSHWPLSLPVSAEKRPRLAPPNLLGKPDSPGHGNPIEPIKPVK
ncbi:hypothetical protein BC939DRAFT_504262 [Gamsiella multidivaricata]|uniref:uncharacterized protein n=1 Tax=Gamsiella multidivaricata TaxID=101098 RepID=UPI00221F0392|nr:uncharacterized protein BC939DRAFT_504262 [Gamsiella multidivaricata]KAI7821741.1 hypothetical protein BC939DRAFT_504262 [Gamsiella multidivaricata]